MPKTLLCIPPDYDYNFPPLGTPALCAFLKTKGIDAFQIDLNIKYRDFLTANIGGSVLSIKEKRFFLKTLLKKFFHEKLQGRYYSDFLARDKVAMFPVLPYDNNTNSSFFFTERLLSSPHLFRYLEDIQENTFLQFYNKIKILDSLDKGGINFLGISIISPSQVIASLTLGLLVKKHLPRIHINIGGQWPTLYRRQIAQKKEFFRCFDSVIAFEGETALFELISSLDKKRDISGVTNIILKGADLEKKRNWRLGEDMNSLPGPDFDGLPLKDYNEYTKDGPVLTYETSRGCYWGKCAYCVDLPLPKPLYRRKSANLVARDILELKKKYNTRSLMLGDPGVSPRQMLEVSEALIKNKAKVGWWCMARLDNGFNRSIFEKAHRAGLWQVNFGFESASDSVCDLLDKGNRSERSSRVIKDCKGAGVSVDLQTIVGLPKETSEDALKTVDFLVKHKAYVNNVSFNIFYLTPENYVFKNPQKYGLTINKKDILPFSFFIPFKNKEGITVNEAYLLQKLYFSLMEKEGSVRQKALKEGSRLILAKEVIEGRITLRLNGEKSSVYFLKREKTEDAFLIDDVYHDMFVKIRKGTGLKTIIRQWRKKGPEVLEAHLAFVAEALEKGFLRYA